MVKKLSKNKEAFLLALLSNSTIKDASEQVGISTQTGHQYLNDPEFKKAYSQVRKDTFQLATNKLQSSFTRAVEVLNEVMEDEQSPASSRVQAAKTIVQNAYKSYEIDELEERLDRIEDMIKDNQS